jgi:hypothetical protein
MTSIICSKVIIQMLLFLLLNLEQLSEAFNLERNQLSKLPMLAWQSANNSLFFLHFQPKHHHVISC